MLRIWREGLLMLLEKYDGREIVNVGGGRGFDDCRVGGEREKGGRVFLEGRYDGIRASRMGRHGNLLDVTKIRGMGWKPKVYDGGGDYGLAYDWFLKNAPEAKG